MDKARLLLRRAAATALLAAVAVLASCGGKTASTSSGKASIICDESVENIIRQEVQVYELKYPSAMFSVQYINEDAAIDSLLALKTQLIVVSKELTPDQVKYVESQKYRVSSMPIAVDAIAVIANKENPVEMLSVGQLADILTGRVTNWNEISPNKSGDIAVVFDHQGSSTVNYMRKKVTAGMPFTTKNVYAQKTNKEVFRAVETHKNAIGVIGVSWLSRNLTDMAISANYSKEEIAALDAAAEVNHEISSDAVEGDESYSEKVKVVPIRRNDLPYAFKPYQEDIYQGDYPLFRTVYAICIAPRGTLTSGFYGFLSSVLGQKVILNTGVLPANMPPQRSVMIIQE